MLVDAMRGPIIMPKHVPWKAVAGMIFALILGAAIAAHELGILR
jgi:hypothetical protein